MKLKILSVVLILVGVLLWIGASIAIGFYDTICETGFDPKACIFISFVLGLFVGVGGVVMLGAMEDII